MSETILCKSCGYKGPVESFDVSFSVYSDIRCPDCNSTNNKHNADYLQRLQDNWNKTVDGKKPEGPQRSTGERV